LNNEIRTTRYARYAERSEAYLTIGPFVPVVKMMAWMIRETIEETYNGMPEPELADTQFLKVMAETIYYKRTEA